MPRVYTDPQLQTLQSLGVLFETPPEGSPNMPGIVFEDDEPTEIQTPSGARVAFPGGGGGGGGTTFSEATVSGVVDLSDLVDGEVRLLHVNGAVTDVTWPAIDPGTAMRCRLGVEALGADRDLIEFLNDNAFDYTGANTTVPQDFFAEMDLVLTPETRFVQYINSTGNLPPP
jgi:hypothetical protein